MDLPIAVALLVADGQVPAPPPGIAFLGELGLDGSLRSVPGALAMVAACRSEAVVVPPGSASEAGLLGEPAVLTAATLRGVVDALAGRRAWDAVPERTGGGRLPPVPDLADVRGQPLGRLAVEVAAAGGHHLLMVGPPGAGKTMLAERLPGLLPPLDAAEALEVTQVHSAAGLPLPPGSLVRRAPFRAPHHSASPVSLIGGGGAVMRPGEISCAHHGVLFLDELGEFPAAVLDSLRQPLEEGQVLVCRARASISFPARVLLVAAMNPCPCGQDSGPGSCRCSDSSRMRYLRRVSGPLLDRFDVRIVVDRPDVDELLEGAAGVAARRPPESSEQVAARVAAARTLAVRHGVRCNAAIPAAALDSLAPLDPAAGRLLEARLRQGVLSARGLHRVRRVARTIADLAGVEGAVRVDDVYGALALRVPVLGAPEGEWGGTARVGP
jgi:magnesium chelatase family protein